MRDASWKEQTSLKETTLNTLKGQKKRDSHLMDFIVDEMLFFSCITEVGNDNSPETQNKTVMK